MARFVDAISPSMMSIDLPADTPPPHRGNAAPSSRGAPCAGLFGWRKDGEPAITATAQKKERKPKRDYSAG